LKSEIEKYDRLWKADRTIRWARENGVRINRVILAAHRKNHLDIPSRDEIKPPESNPAASTMPVDAKAIPGLPVDDLAFLDTVRDKAFEKLLAGDYDLKLEAAFKAIEIKYKISDQSWNEKLLLELLNQIRTEELSAKSNSPVRTELS